MGSHRSHEAKMQMFNLQNILLTLLSYLKIIFYTFLAGLSIPYKPPTGTTSSTSAYITRRRSNAAPQPPVDHDALISRISTLAENNEAAAHMHAMIAHNGAGSWPPRFPTSLSTWPAPLRAYHTVYLASAPYLYTRTPSTSDNTNIAIRSAFRARLGALLATHVDLAAVSALLAEDEARHESSPDSAPLIPQDVLNAFYACVAMTRHAFRWATIPAVRVAQQEKVIAFPAALAAPWPFLQRRYGFASLGGNVLSNFLYHWAGPAAGPAYRVNVGRDVAANVESAEYWFAYMFAETERLALPVYAEVVECLAAWERGDRGTVLAALKRMRDAVRVVNKVLYDNMIESKVEREVWLGWVQGFHAYGAGIEGEDGEFIEFNGVSANQLPFFQIIDAFLGLGSYLTQDESRATVPVRQRRVCAEVRKRSFRKEVKDTGDEEVEREMSSIAKLVRVWRAAHRVRIVPYLAQPAPERMLMTAGKSLLENESRQGANQVLEFLDYLVRNRMEQTK